MKIAYRLLFVLLISMFLFGCGDKTTSVEGKIVDGKGKPVPGLSVIFKQVQPTQGYEQFEAKSDAGGIVRLTGLAPSSDYTISILSDKWKTNVIRKIKTLEAGKNLALTDPIKIRFNQMKNGTVIDTKTGLQWLIHPASDITASNVIATVKGLNQAGFTDWRLPSRADLASLLEEKIPAKTPTAEPVLVNKTCCAWVAEPNSEVDWKFYVEEENELWKSSKDSPDNRIIVVRNYSVSPLTPSVTPTEAAQAPVVVPPPPAAGQAPATAVKTEAPAVKTTTGVRQASRKACAEKKTQAAKSEKTAPSIEPSAAKAAPSRALAPVGKTDTAKVVNSPPVKIQEPVRAEAPAKRSESSVTESIYFDVGSSSLKTQEIAKLKSLLAKIKGEKGTLNIDGYSDATGSSDATNLMVSLHRASNVAAAVNKIGVGKNIKLELKASGVSKPVASNDNADGRQKNRRVEVSFMPE